VVGDLVMKMFDAMILKRKIFKNCNVDVTILDTSGDGFVLSFEKIINNDSFTLISDFVRKHQLNILFDNGVYFISNQVLAPSELTYQAE
jgi:hypothetical protein